MECQRNSNYVRLRKEVLRRVQGEPMWVFYIKTQRTNEIVLPTIAF
jgi:hypothetical protein